LQESIPPDQDGAHGESPPQSSLSYGGSPGTTPSMMGELSVKAYSASNSIDPVFQQAIEQRTNFWKSAAGSSGNKCALSLAPKIACRADAVFLSD
jgi:hypothetical protein